MTAAARHGTLLLMPTQTFSTCGVEYTVHEDGRISVADQGFPMLDDGSRKVIAKIWEVYGRDIAFASDKFKIPPAWLIGFIYCETGFLVLSGKEATAGSPCEPKYCPALWNAGKCADQGGPEKYCAGGLMQFISSTAGIFGKNLEHYMQNPGEMIHDAAWLISVGGPSGTVYAGGVYGSKRFWDICSIAKMYNGGSVCGGGTLTGHGGQGDYVAKHIRACNTFVDMNLPVPEGAPEWARGGVGAAGAGAAVAFVLGVVAYMMADIHWGITNRVLDRMQQRRRLLYIR